MSTRRKPRPGEIVPPLPKPERQAPQGYVYLAWQGNDFSHLSADQTRTLCGVVNQTASDPLVTTDPFGKPRCPECLTLAGITPEADEPVPVPREGQEAVTASEPAPQPGPQPPKLKMPPPEFFRGVRKG